MSGGEVELRENLETTFEQTEANDTFTDEMDSKQLEKHSKNLVNVSKRLLAKYLIWHRCGCLFMIWIHVSMGLLSIVASSSTSEVSSESHLCRYIFYSSHYFYGYINFALSGIYLYLFSVFSINAITELKNADWILLGFMGLVMYVALLKMLSDLNCTFWGITFRQLFVQGVQFAAEGLMVKLFYSWLHSKTEILKITLEENIDMARTEQYIK